MDDFESLRKRHLTEARAFTAEAISRLSWSSEQVLEEQTIRLREVVAHAQQSSVFHADRLGNVEATRLELSDLPKLPPMTKADVMENWDRVVTDSRLRLTDVNKRLKRELNGEEINPYYLDKYYAAATGGSSGKRGLFLWDWETFVIMVNLTQRMEAQEDLADPPKGPKRTAVICAGSYVHGSRFIFPAMLDPEREVQIVPASLSIKDMVEQLNAYQPDRIIGYSSLVEELAAQALDGPLKIQPQRVSTNSEPLTDHARQMALEAWGINIHNQWGSVEIGVAASEGKSFAGMTMAEDFLIFEPVNERDEPVRTGSADRLLVTKLYGHVMPMIRYELTDTVVIDDGPNPDAPGFRRITEIKGRADNWFVYNGGIKVHPMVFRSILGQEPHISEYQVQQTARGARVLAVAHGEFSKSHLQSLLVDSLAQAGFAEAEVTVETVTDLPRHHETNKLKRFVPLD